MDRPAETLPRLVRPVDLLSELERDASAAHQAHATKQPRGPISGLSKLDRELGGALPPGVHVLHGGPGVGKTALLLQLAAHCECPALLVSCEMAPLELLRRLTARATDTYLGRLRTGELPPEEVLSLAERAIKEAPHLTLVDATDAFASPEWIKQAALATKGNAQHLLVGVDSVHSWSDASGIDVPEYERLTVALGALRKLAGALDCPVMAVAERNRASMNSGGLHAMAGSRKFEYGAETVVELDREGDGPPDASGEVTVKLTLSKNRHGVPGRQIPLRFHGALQRFREVDR